MSNEPSEPSEPIDDVYRVHGRRLLRRCRRLLRDPALAEDALHDAFVRMLRYGDAYRTAESKVAWLNRVVDNCCYDTLERRRDRRCEPPATRAAPCPLDRLGAARALARLPAPERRLALLAFVHEMSQGEIAAQLGWSRQTINKKLTAIRGRLARWLDAA
jgi:RNA polymerase sigma-70 factor (ECF subfamily)